MVIKSTYVEGNWTRKTSETLDFVNSKSSQNVMVTIAELPGTYRNWVYVLKRSGHIIDDNGLKLTDKGLLLLADLKSKDLPSRQRRKVSQEFFGKNQPINTSEKRFPYRLLLESPSQKIEAYLLENDFKVMIKAYFDLIYGKK